MGCDTPVDVSACTIEKTLASGFASSAARTSSGRMTWPHSDSTRTTSAPARDATSDIRPPKTPLTPTIAISPGSSTFTKAASMPALPVPETANVIRFLRREDLAQALRQLVEDREERSGPEIPTSGRLSACKDLGDCVGRAGARASSRSVLITPERRARAKQASGRPPQTRRFGATVTAPSGSRSDTSSSAPGSSLWSSR